jgi:putative molybdopterin biosynthesis protein
MGSPESVYLHDIPLQEALSKFRLALEEAGLWSALETEDVPLERALGRVTADAVWACISSPHYHAAAMDGYALRACDTEGATDRDPISLQIGTQAVYVDTGDPMPEWSDAVVPVEYVETIGDSDRGRAREAIRLRAPLAPWIHVRPMGEDMVATELVLPAGQALRPVDIGAIAGCGHDSVGVRRKPRVAIIPTGSELVPIGSPVKPGQILEYNSLMLAGQVESWGGTPTRLPIVPDDLKRIKNAISQAAKDHDLVLVNAGSSAGAEDFTAPAVEALGDLLVHGVAVRPGHPVVLGVIRTKSRGSTKGRSVPVIGVPGYPVSTVLTGEIFVEPLLARWLGRPSAEPQVVQATMTRKVHSSLGDDEYLRVTVGRVGERLVTTPLARGAGVITSLVRADGIVLIPAGVQGIVAGEDVVVRLYRSLAEIERTVVALGSHDLTIDLLGQFLAERGGRLTSANLGSLGGLIALQRGEAHLAGSHMLDPETGEYNLGYVQKYLPDTPVVLLGLVSREQGLIVTRGNPQQIKSLQDLTREGITFINRQRGSGTRFLLDYHLEQLGVAADNVSGYDHEEYSHLMIAAAIASGRVSCGLGIRAAAEALDLDFIPLFKERYDLVIPDVHYSSDKLAPLLELLQDEAFRQAVAELPGYDVDPMGEEIARLG